MVVLLYAVLAELQHNCRITLQILQGPKLDRSAYITGLSSSGKQVSSCPNNPQCSTANPSHSCMGTRGYTLACFALGLCYTAVFHKKLLLKCSPFITITLTHAFYRELFCVSIEDSAGVTRGCETK